MAEISLTLYIDLDQGSHIDLDVAANAALAWTDLIRAVGQHVDPFTEWKVELESALPGSQRLRSIIRLPMDPETRGMVKGAVAVSLMFILKEAAAWGVSEVLDYLKGPDAPTESLSFSDQERTALAEEIVQLLQSSPGREEVRSLYRALDRDEKVCGAGATSGSSGKPSIVVPRTEFSSRLEDVTSDELPQRTLPLTTELTLIRPVLTTDTSRRWGFQSSFGTFGAPIRDQVFLASLAEGRLNVPLAQGIRMIVEMEVTESLDGGVWKPIERVVTRVVRVIPPPQQETLNLLDP